MKRIMCLTTAVALFLGQGNVVFAADLVTTDQPCSCIADAGSAGRIISASGDVAVTGGSAYGAAKAGTAVGAGSEVVVNSGSATVQVGKCTEKLSSNSSLQVSPTGNGQLCLMNTGMGAPAAASAGLSPAAWTVLGVAAAVGIGVAIANNNDDDDDNHRRRNRPATSD